MKRPVLKLNELTLPEKVELSGNITTDMAANAAIFPNPNPPLLTLTNQRSALVVKIMEHNNLEQMLHASTVELNLLETEFDRNLLLEAAYVDSVSNGDESIIYKAGMMPKKSPTPIGALPKVDNLKASVGERNGYVDLHWNKVHGAKSYVIESCEHLSDGSPHQWTGVALSTKSSVTVKNLVSGKAMLFRVAAVGAAGQGPWSNPCAIYVP